VAGSQIHVGGGLIMAKSRAHALWRGLVRVAPEKFWLRGEPTGEAAADALRYLVATKARTITVRKLRGL
jgi:hypothetical protein